MVPADSMFISTRLSRGDSVCARLTDALLFQDHGYKQWNVSQRYWLGLLGVWLCHKTRRYINFYNGAAPRPVLLKATGSDGLQSLMPCIHITYKLFYMCLVVLGLFIDHYLYNQWLLSWPEGGSFKQCFNTKSWKNDKGQFNFETIWQQYCRNT